jgi:adenylate cyclase
MTEIIMQRDGYVDKYVGDLIMAEWGVPYAVPDHALQACRAALEQIAALEKLNLDWKERFGHSIAVRIGVNTGVVTAGNMGSRRRFQYTVMGDAVNLAARLEPLNKEYGTTILIGERTAELVKDALNVRLVDRVTLHGRSTPENVYELIGEKTPA